MVAVVVVVEVVVKVDEDVDKPGERNWVER